MEIIKFTEKINESKSRAWGHVIAEENHGRFRLPFTRIRTLYHITSLCIKVRKTRSPCLQDQRLLIPMSLLPSLGTVSCRLRLPIPNGSIIYNGDNMVLSYFHSIFSTYIKNRISHVINPCFPSHDKTSPLDRHSFPSFLDVHIPLK